MAKNFRNTREFREAMLEALGTTQDKDVENEANFKSALLEALGVEHTRSDVVNFETFREKLVEGITNKSDGGGGGGSSDFSTVEVTVVNNRNDNKVDVAGCCVFSSDGIQASMANIPCDTQGTYAYECILYKGKAFVNVTYAEGVTMAYTGDIEVQSDSGYDYCLVTGDCTITIEEEK